MVSTANRGGQALSKHFKVYTDDPSHTQTELTVTGKVMGYVEITPERVSLVGPVGKKLSREVRIVPRKGHPFTIKEVKAKAGRDIRLELTPIGDEPAQEGYLLSVTITRQEPGVFGDYIEIQTDSKEKPTIGIPVSGRLYNAPVEDRQETTQ